MSDDVMRVGWSRDGGMSARARIALAVAVLVVGVIGGVMFALRRAPVNDVLGVRLGTTVKDTRDRFVPGAPGSWTLETSPEPVLSWQATTNGDVRAATFEFHSGLLVAMRLEVTPASSLANGPPVEVSLARVLARDSHRANATTQGNSPAETASSTIDITVIARDCPTHVAEVKQILSRASTP